jgi:integrase
MATINFKIQEKAKIDPTKIYIRLKGKDFDYNVPTELLVSKKEWSNAKQKTKSLAESDSKKLDINKTLKDLKNFIVDELNNDQKEGFSIDKKWLTGKINLFSNKSSNDETDSNFFLSSYVSTFIENSKTRTNKRTGKTLTNRTIQDFEDTSNKLKLYEQKIGKRIKISEIDLKFHKDFIEFLRKELILGENTIGGKIDNLKAFLREAELSRINVNPIFKSKSFYSPSLATKDIYFDLDEINRIKNYPFELDSYLDNARDWLMIGLWTGLRISDLKSITKKDLKNGYIDNRNFKTDIPVTIPIHPHVGEIINKRNGELPRKISDQNFNDYIKEVSQIVGFNEKVSGSKMCLLLDKDNNPLLDKKGKKIHRKKQGIYFKYELVTSHICRRSFATNLYGKIDTLTIMKITGHKTEKQFLSYIKITPKHHAEKLKNFWDQNYK